MKGDPQDSAPSRFPLAIVSLGSSGSGKSRTGDEIGALMFSDKSVKLLKVTYNCRGSIQFDHDRPVDAFHFRLICAASNLLPGLAYVNEFLQHCQHHNWRMSEKSCEQYLADHVREKYWILVVDELTKLNNKEAAARILNQTSWFSTLSMVSSDDGTPVTTHEDATRWCVSYVTSLDFETLAPYTISGRSMLPLSRYLLDAKNSASLCGQFHVDATSPKGIQLLKLCGGHPRSIIYAAQKLKTTGVLLTAAQLGSEAQITPIGTEDLGKMIAMSYSPIKASDVMGDEMLQKYLKSGILLFSPTEGQTDTLEYCTGYISIPPPLIAHACSGSDIEPYKSFRRMLQHEKSTPTKQLEIISIYSDIARNALGLKVIPKNMKVHFPVQCTWPSSEDFNVDFAFDVTVPPVQRNVIESQKKEWSLAMSIEDMLKPCVKIPENPSHAAMESMYPVKLADGSLGMAVHQQKINADFTKAITGLNKFAELLRGQGFEGFILFIVIVMDARKPDLNKSNEPILFVSYETARDYFTPSFATAAQIEYLKHHDEHGSGRFMKSDNLDRSFVYTAGGDGGENL